MAPFSEADFAWRQFCREGKYHDAIGGLNQAWKKSDVVKLRGKQGYLELVQRSVKYVYSSAETEITRGDSDIYELIARKPNNWTATLSTLVAAPSRSWRGNSVTWTAMELGNHSLTGAEARVFEARER